MSRQVERLGNNPGVYPIHPQPNEGKGDLSGTKEPLVDPRKERIEWWRNAPEKVIKYRSGYVRDVNGNILYRYGRGSRLLIGDQEKGEDIEVMDTCQTPWANATVDRAFEELGIRNRPIDVLERGFGMGITATRVINHLVIPGGNYTVIELNKLDEAYAREEWKNDKERGIERITRLRGLPKNGQRVSIEVIEGEAYEETVKLAEAGKKFDIIISDTYPLTEDERGMNDLLDLETLKRCLKPHGGFAFFAHFPGSTEDVAYKQVNMITTHFRNYSVSRASINPPPDYKYLQPDTGPIRSLPVVVCKNPIL